LGGINKHPRKIEEGNLPLLYIIYKCEEGNRENKEERNKIPVIIIIRHFIYPCYQPRKFSLYVNKREKI